MVLLHRQLAAEILGRPLRPEEVVHHRDGNGLNNAPENLEVLPDQRHHVHVEYHQKRWRGGQLPLSPDWLPAVALSQSGSVGEGEGAAYPSNPRQPRHFHR
ncbi:HNH endonuclease [Deinococcus sp. YIM 134068]|uniref:HNH endonuclease n=1 Tax=Deinococcus lichenicola TaxID=3118910 RepID=UPI002F95D44E